MISNVSFVVIARNAEFAVRKCIKSICGMKLDNCEIICVDSASTDGTLAVMKEFASLCSFIRVFKCSGRVNSAIARNVGRQNISKEAVFFIDGDVEATPAFAEEALKIIRRGDADIVTGQLAEIYYEPGYKREIRRVTDRFLITCQKEVFFSGGCFIASAEVVRKAGPWDDLMVRNQDWDYTLKLSRHGRFLAIPISMGTHHTLLNLHRSWDFIRRGYPMYFGVVLRRNLDRPRVVMHLMWRNRAALLGMIFYCLLFVCVSITCVHRDASMRIMTIPIALVILDLAWSILREKNVLSQLLLHYVHAPLALVGLFRNLNGQPLDVSIERVC